MISTILQLEMENFTKFIYYPSGGTYHFFEVPIGRIQSCDWSINDLY